MFVYTHVARQLRIACKKRKQHRYLRLFSLYKLKKQDTTLKIAIFYLNLTATSTKHKGPALTGSNQNTLYKSYRTWLKPVKA